MHTQKSLAASLFPRWSIRFSYVIIFSGFWALQLYVSKLAFTNGAGLGAFVFQSALATLLISAVFLIPRLAPELRALWSNNSMEAQHTSRAARRKTLRLVLLANFIHYGLGAMFSAAGIAGTTATNAAFLSKLSFVFTIGLAYFLLGEPITRKKVAAGGLMLLGSYLLATQAKLITPAPGDLLILIACVWWAIGNTLSKVAIQHAHVSGDLIAALRPFVGSPFLLAYSLLAPRIAAPTSQAWGATVLDPAVTPFALLNGAMTILAWIYLNRTLSVATASYMTMMSMMTPVMVAMLGSLTFGEQLSGIQLLGAVLIIGGAVFTHFVEKRNSV